MANPLQDLAALVVALSDAYRTRFGDAEKDVVAVEDLEQLLADLGVPDAALALAVTQALNAVVVARIVNTPPGGDPGQYWFYHAGPTVGGR